MIYKSKEGDIELENLTRLYPAVVIDMQGERAEMSLEWMELYAQKVELVHYVLVFDFTQPGEEERDRTVLIFDTREELMQEIQEVAKYFD